MKLADEGAHTDNTQRARVHRCQRTALEPEMHVGRNEGQEALLQMCSTSLISLGQSAERMRGEP